jgi:mono/diheme cytochrome c family protein
LGAALAANHAPGVFFSPHPRATGVAKCESESYSTCAVPDGLHFRSNVRNVFEAKEITMTLVKRVLIGLALALAVPTIAAAQAKGQDIFKAKCAMCHGADGSASTGMGKSMGLKPLSSPEVQNMSDADLTALITNGKGKMPAYKGKLTDAQIGDVVSFIRTLK